MKDSIRIGLFGFGRIGRNIFRQAYKNSKFEIVAISDLGQAKAMHYLLMRDSIHGVMDDEIILEGESLKFNNHSVHLLAGGKPGNVPWDIFDVDIVIDSTGAYRLREELQPHLDAGAKRILVSKPSKDKIDRTIIKGINDEEIQPTDKIISTTSSTTQVLALMLKILDEAFGVKQAMMTTVHAYTSDQPLADAVNSDLRRSRSAVQNIIPNDTWAPDYVSQLMPQFKNKLTGMAFNVPVANGSCVDLTTEMEKMPSIEAVNAAFKAASENGLRDIIGYTEDPIVSSDAIASGDTMVFDSQATMIAAGKLLKTISWFDNGWGFANRILDLADAYASLGES